MAISEKQRQKKLGKKTKKKNQSLAKRKKEGTGIILSKRKAVSYAAYPLYECLMPNGLFKIGIGSVLISRKAPNGLIAVGIFVVDVFCLGVKNASFKVLTKFDYEKQIKESLITSHEGQAFEAVDPACIKKLLEGAVAYSEELGFTHHPEYKNAKDIFGDIDSSSCPVNYNYGKDGKPFYFRGPKETPALAKKIVNQLHEHCGEGGYDYMLMVGEG